MEKIPHIQRLYRLNYNTIEQFLDTLKSQTITKKKTQKDTMVHPALLITIIIHIKGLFKI